jgi:hypothetical protein
MLRVGGTTWLFVSLPSFRIEQDDGALLQYADASKLTNRPTRERRELQVRLCQRFPCGQCVRRNSKAI